MVQTVTLTRQGGNPTFSSLIVNGPTTLSGGTLTGELNLNYVTPILRLTDSAATGNNGNVSLRAEKTGVGYNTLNYIGYEHIFKGGGSESTFLTINSAGASIFSSSVTAGGALRISGGSTFTQGEIEFTNTASAGQLGIFTNQLTTSTLFFDHRGTGNTGNFLFRNGTGGSNTLMYIAGNGNVGIGIFPSYALQVTGSTFLAGSTKFIVGGNNYNENIRCYAQSNDYSSIILGAVAGDSGTGAGQWSIVRWPSVNSYKFTIRYNATDSLTIDTSSNLTMVGNVTAYSDARVKTNIKTIDNALSKVLALRGVTYNRTDLEDKSEQIGVIAQEIKEILPQVVQKTDGRYSVAYGNIVGVLIEAIKEQQLQIEELKSRL